jgi:TetR/AcrR family fatty acid metabolism transcriptional regulator
MAELRSTSSRRERQSAARSEEILDAAARLFAERGFHRTTTRDIADAAEVAEGTLYNYFANKDDLLMGIMRRLTDSLNDEGRQIEALPVAPRDHFFAWLQMRKNFQEDHAAMMQAVFSEILANVELRERYFEQLLEPSIASLEESLREHIQIGEIKPVDVPATARVFVSIIIGLFFLEVLGDPFTKSEAKTLDKIVISLLFEGIAPERESEPNSAP